MTIVIDRYHALAFLRRLPQEGIPADFVPNAVQCVESGRVTPGLIEQAKRLKEATATPVPSWWLDGGASAPPPGDPSRTAWDVGGSREAEYWDHQEAWFHVIAGMQTAMCESPWGKTFDQARRDGGVLQGVFALAQRARLMSPV